MYCALYGVCIRSVRFGLTLALAHADYYTVLQSTVNSQQQRRFPLRSGEDRLVGTKAYSSANAVARVAALL